MSVARFVAASLGRGTPMGYAAPAPRSAAPRVSVCPMPGCPGFNEGVCGKGRGTTPCVCGHPVCQHTLFSKYGCPCKVTGCECRDWIEAFAAAGYIDPLPYQEVV